MSELFGYNGKDSLASKLKHKTSHEQLKLASNKGDGVVTSMHFDDLPTTCPEIGPRTKDQKTRLACAHPNCGVTIFGVYHHHTSTGNIRSISGSNSINDSNNGSTSASNKVCNSARGQGSSQRGAHLPDGPYCLLCSKDAKVADPDFHVKAAYISDDYTDEDYALLKHAEGCCRRRHSRKSEEVSSFYNTVPADEPREPLLRPRIISRDHRVRNSDGSWTTHMQVGEILKGLDTAVLRDLIGSVAQSHDKSALLNAPAEVQRYASSKAAATLARTTHGTALAANTDAKRDLKRAQASENNRSHRNSSANVDTACRSRGSSTRGLHDPSMRDNLMNTVVYAEAAVSNIRQECIAKGLEESATRLQALSREGEMLIAQVQSLLDGRMYMLANLPMGRDDLICPSGNAECPQCDLCGPVSKAYHDDPVADWKIEMAEEAACGGASTGTTGAQGDPSTSTNRAIPDPVLARFVSRKRGKEFYSVPKNLFNKEGTSIMLIGGKGNGTVVHVDWSEAYNVAFGTGLIVGTEEALAYWLFISPDRHIDTLRYMKTKGYHNKVITHAEMDEVVAYANDEDEVFVLKQCAGDMVHVSPGWCHAVVNEQECVKVAWDFVRPQNLYLYVASWMQVARSDRIQNKQKDYMAVLPIIVRMMRECKALLWSER